LSGAVLDDLQEDHRENGDAVHRYVVKETGQVGGRAPEKDE